MNYASVVFAGFSAIAALWYAINARKHYQGPVVSRVKREDVHGVQSEVPVVAEKKLDGPVGA